MNIKFNEFINEKLITDHTKVQVGKYEYIIDTKQKVKPNDYCYMSPTYNDGISGFIIKITEQQTYPKTDDNKYWTIKDDGSVYNVDVITPEVLGKNHWDMKVHIPKSYHLSHCNAHGSGKVISSNNPNLIIDN